MSNRAVYRQEKRFEFHFYKGPHTQFFFGRIPCYRGVTLWVWRLTWSIYW